MTEKMLNAGKWLIEEYDSSGKLIRQEVVKNRIMSSFLNDAIDILTGEVTDWEIKYLAVGTSAAAITDADTQLGAEAFRTPDTFLQRTSLGQVQSKFVILDTEALVNIKEIGVFCGSTATAAANSGKLLSRILWNKDRTSGATTIHFTRLDTIERK